jgi:hypothetical protein
MKILKLVLLYSLLVVISGCAELMPRNFGPDFTPPTSLPPRGVSKVYIYNPYQDNSISDYLVLYVDNAKVAELPTRSYSLVTVSPGKHFFGVGAEPGDLFSSQDGKVINANVFQLQANKIYYIEYQRKIETHKPAFINIVIGHSDDPEPDTYLYVTQRGFVVHEDLNSASNIATCKFVTPLNGKF